MNLGHFPRSHGGNPLGRTLDEVHCRLCKTMIHKSEAIAERGPDRKGSHRTNYYCPECFDRHSRGERKVPKGPEAHVASPPITPQEAQWLNSYKDDVAIVDERGRLTWARALAKRYRREMMGQKGGHFSHE